MDLNMFTQTIIPVKDKLFRFAYAILGNAMEAEDVVQEVLIKLWNQREHIDQIQNLDAWCIRVTKNLAIDKTRSVHRRAFDLPEQTEMADRSVNPHRAAELGDAVEKVKQLMNRLPASQRMVMQLRDIEGLAYDEIAQQLELSMEQVKVYLHRARKTIREQLIKTESYGLQNH